MTTDTDYPNATDFSKKPVGKNGESANDLADNVSQATGIDRNLISRAQEAIEQAVDTTVAAVKENPVAAAAIVGGVAAVAAGAAYGISKLGTAAGETAPKSTGGKSGKGK
ncbi:MULTISPECIES: hypothetical protein [Sphingomonas]|uniref:hypothetical protein n=1 Tax=Sphingomonas TaxID=13687 RepID=UPI00082A4FA7|nr:hypothetical protein [Sphingomonas sp. CCH10-B3]